MILLHMASVSVHELSLHMAAILRYITLYYVHWRSTKAHPSKKRCLTARSPCGPAKIRALQSAMNCSSGEPLNGSGKLHELRFIVKYSLQVMPQGRSPYLRSISCQAMRPISCTRSFWNRRSCARTSRCRRHCGAILRHRLTLRNNSKAIIHTLRMINIGIRVMRWRRRAASADKPSSPEVSRFHSELSCVSVSHSETKCFLISSTPFRQA